MAFDIWPYSDRSSGAVSDAEHEDLWTPELDGILRGQSADAFRVAVNGTAWTAQPGKAIVGGHVISSSGVASGNLAANNGSTDRIDAVVLRLDRTQEPWDYEVTIRQGTPGGGQPSISRDSAGVQELLLATIKVAPGSATSLLNDCRVRHAGSLLTGTSAQKPYGSVDGTLFYESDTGRLIQRQGSNWVTVNEDTGWVSVTPKTPWYTGSMYMRRKGGYVTVAGILTRGQNTLPAGDDLSEFATIPVGFRPGRRWVKAASFGNTNPRITRMVVETDGRFYQEYPSGTMPTGFTIDMSQVSGWPTD